MHSRQCYQRSIAWVLLARSFQDDSTRWKGKGRGKGKRTGFIPLESFHVFSVFIVLETISPGLMLQKALCTYFSTNFEGEMMMMIDRDTLTKHWRSQSVWRCLEHWKAMRKAMPVSQSVHQCPSHCLRGFLTSPHAGLYLSRPFSASSPSSTL